MKGKNWSIPAGMILKKHYCTACGSRLKKEATKRIVTKDDKDYYMYHERGTYPRYDEEVIEYRFMCPHCNNRYLFIEQQILSIIQKKLKCKQLSKEQIKTYYQTALNIYIRRTKILEIITRFVVLVIVALVAYYATGNYQEGTKGLISAIVIVIICIIFIAIQRIIYRKKRYTKYEKYIYHKLYKYTINNKTLIENSEVVHCFNCGMTLNPQDITEYITNEQTNDITALCPHCQKQTIIPDNIDILVTKEILEGMKDYWL